MKGCSGEMGRKERVKGGKEEGRVGEREWRVKSAGGRDGTNRKGKGLKGEEGRG